MPFNEAFDIIQKLRQASMFGAPPLERQFATPADTGYVRQDVANTAQRIPQDDAPQSSDDDILARIQSMFPQQHEAQDRLRELMNQQPSRSQYKPSFWRRLAAGAVAGGDIGGADRWANKKYYGAEEEWKSRLNPIKELADSEQNINTNNRSISNQLILNESRTRETERKAAKDKTDAEIKREQLDEKYYYAGIREQALYQPNMIQFTDETGGIFNLDKKSGAISKAMNPETGMQLKSNKLPEEEQLKLKQNQELARIAARGSQQRQTVAAQGEKEIAVDEAKTPNKIKVKTTVPGKNTAPVEGSGSTKTGYKKDDKKTFDNGNVGQWDGKNWVLIGKANVTPAK